ncbi:MAG: nucleotidyltransferase domain-containing protein [Pseudomonadota bacterium]
MIPQDIRTEVMRRIAAAEEEHGVRVIYAVESGSRAWGFASQNSDYDVRFVYAHRAEWYLCVDLEERRDVIEYPIVDDIDINGWDIRKALKLFWKSNPALIEWLKSPIVYKDDGRFAPATRALLDSMYSIDKGIYHYRSMAKTNYRGYLKEDIVPIKKYFYVLRPLLAIRWLKEYQRPAPIEFDKLRTMIRPDSDFDIEISILLERKKQSREKEVAPAIPVLNRFIESELQALENLTPVQPDLNRDMEKLNAIFKAHLDT